MLAALAVEVEVVVAASSYRANCQSLLVSGRVAAELSKLPHCPCGQLSAASAGAPTQASASRRVGAIEHLYRLAMK